jgi:large exoprotein involved in heme utilization and adhesion
MVNVDIDRVAAIGNEGQISSRSRGAGNSGSINLGSTAGSIELTRNAIVGSAADVGNSGDVTIAAGGSVLIDNSFVTTTSLGGSAGPITINSEIIDTRNAQINTTTGSTTADGGDISIKSEVFILEETIIQANADSGSGGEIIIDSSAIIPQGNQLNINSTTQLAFDGLVNNPIDGSTGNVIQAVAENGVTVPPTLTTPVLDIGSVLAEVDPNLDTAGTVVADPCAGFRSGGPSTLISSGRSALPDSTGPVLSSMVDLNPGAVLNKRRQGVSFKHELKLSQKQSGEV